MQFLKGHKFQELVIFTWFGYEIVLKLQNVEQNHSSVRHLILDNIHFKITWQSRTIRNN